MALRSIGGNDTALLDHASSVQDSDMEGELL